MHGTRGCNTVSEIIVMKVHYSVARPVSEERSEELLGDVVEAVRREAVDASSPAAAAAWSGQFSSSLGLIRCNQWYR
jgi:hypothetical protein